MSKLGDHRGRRRSRPAGRGAALALVWLLGEVLFPGVPRAADDGTLVVTRELILSSPGLGAGNAVIELSGGGFAAVGYTDAGTDSATDVLLLRLDAAGELLWQRVYGEGGRDFGWDLVEADDGDLFVVGFTDDTPTGSNDVLVMRLAPDGEPRWRRTIGDDGEEIAWSAVADGAGGLVVAAQSQRAGRQDRDAVVLRVDGEGRPRWTRALADQADERLFSIARTTGGDYVLTGTSAPSRDAARDVLVVRVDAAGELVWRTALGEEPDDVGHGALALPGDEVLVSGYGGSGSAGESDFYLLRLDRRGETVWWRRTGGPGGDRAMMSALTGDGGFVTVGYSEPGSGEWDAAVLESDAEGSPLLHTVLERPGADRGVMILPLRGGAYLLIGSFGEGAERRGDFGLLRLARGADAEPSTPTPHREQERP